MLLELAIGDAYGAAFEFVPAHLTAGHRLAPYARHPRHPIEPGHYTDDTQMSLALTELLVSGKRFSRENLADHFVAAFRRDPRVGYASGFYGFLQTVESGSDFLRGIRPTSSKNGAAMRSVPLGICAERALVIERAVMQARLTHDTPEGIGASAAVALMSHFFLYAHGPKTQLVSYLTAHVPDVPWQTPWQGTVDTQGYSCVRAALTALLQSTSLCEVLERCIAFGGDTDTVACVALGVCASSAQFSHDLPAYLVSGLESGPFGLDYLRDLDKRLLAQAKHP